MMIGISLDGLRRMRWSEAALRFLFGGAMTAAAGLLAKRFGPVVGGLFLAFPAIFPASATLVESTRKKRSEAGACAAPCEAGMRRALMPQGP